jgi:hypothetical protein
VAGGGVAVGAVGVEAGSKYQTRISVRTTAAAMMSNLFVSMGFYPLFSLPHHVSPAWGTGTSLTIRAEKYHCRAVRGSIRLLAWDEAWPLMLASRSIGA